MKCYVRQLLQCSTLSTNGFQQLPNLASPDGPCSFGIHTAFLKWDEEVSQPKWQIWRNQISRYLKPFLQKQTWGFRLRKAYLSLGWNWRGLPFRKWSWITINLHPITLHTKSQLNGNRSLCFFLPFIIILIRLWQVLRCDEASACAKQQWARVLDVEASLNCS